MSTVLVFGRSGQLARALAFVSPEFPSLELRFVGREECDLTIEGKAERTIQQLRPALVINTAAFTSVDSAEDNADAARNLNEIAAGEIAQISAAVRAPLIHVSTDYVFAGVRGQAFTEADEPGPVNVYGVTKLAGEKAVRDAGGEALIVRTAWLYSPFGRNFVRTILDLARRQDEIPVVDDQWGSPTSAIDLARLLLTLASHRLTMQDASLRGILHAAGGCPTNWAEFAEGVMSRSAALGGPSAAIRPIPAEEYGARAPRPASSILGCVRLEEEFGLALPGWEQSLSEVVDAILRQR